MQHFDEVTKIGRFVKKISDYSNARIFIQKNNLKVVLEMLRE